MKLTGNMGDESGAGNIPVLPKEMLSVFGDALGPKLVGLADWNFPVTEDVKLERIDKLRLPASILSERRLGFCERVEERFG
jgi:hypothetical protein